MGFVEDIEKLNKLKQDGAISEQEYQEAKDVLLAKNRPAGLDLTRVPPAPKNLPGVSRLPPRFPLALAP